MTRDQLHAIKTAATEANILPCLKTLNKFRKVLTPELTLAMVTHIMAVETDNANLSYALDIALDTETDDKGKSICQTVKVD